MNTEHADGDSKIRRPSFEYSASVPHFPRPPGASRLSSQPKNRPSPKQSIAQLTNLAFHHPVVQCAAGKMLDEIMRPIVILLSHVHSQPLRIFLRIGQPAVRFLACSPLAMPLCAVSMISR